MEYRVDAGSWERVDLSAGAWIAPSVPPGKLEVRALDDLGSETFRRTLEVAARATATVDLQ
ncbi:MAG TPA: hypothetical protein VM509_04665 [Planctomycetota bacterium]|nr:hypothetical protein [Planctomycetota bacterium]